MGLERGLLRRDSGVRALGLGSRLERSDASRLFLRALDTGERGALVGRRIGRDRSSEGVSCFDTAGIVGGGFRGGGRSARQGGKSENLARERTLGTGSTEICSRLGSVDSLVVCLVASFVSDRD